MHAHAPPGEPQNMLHWPCCPLCLSTAGTYSPHLWRGSCSCFLSSPVAPAGCHRWGGRSSGGETGCWSCSGNLWSPFGSHPKNEQSPLCISWQRKKKSQTQTLMWIKLNISSCACWADRQTDKQTVLGEGDKLLLQHGVLSAQGDGILAVCVSVSEGDVSVVAQVVNCLGEVCLNEIYHSSLLGV